MGKRLTDHFDFKLTNVCLTTVFNASPPHLAVKGLILALSGRVVTGSLHLPLSPFPFPSIVSTLVSNNVTSYASPPTSCSQQPPPLPQQYPLPLPLLLLLSPPPPLPLPSHCHCYYFYPRHSHCHSHCHRDGHCPSASISFDVLLGFSKE